MDFPAIAYKTYQQWKNNSSMSAFFFNVVRTLQSIKNPITKTRKFHQIINENIDSIFEDTTVTRSVSCKIGCSGCCHTPVSVSNEEAQLLAHRVKSGVEISLKNLERQAILGNSSAAYYSLSFENRKCVFLSEKGACSVYEDRPAVCRTNFVVGNPKQCDTSDGKEKPVRLLNTTKADMAIIAGFKTATSSGLLPSMLYRELNRSQNQNQSVLLMRKDSFTEK